MLRLPIDPVFAVNREMLERHDKMRRLRAILRQIQLTHQAKTFACVKDVRHRQIRSRGVERNGGRAANKHSKQSWTEVVEVNQWSDELLKE